MKWFEHTGHIEVKNDRLLFAGKDMELLAKEFQTPLYLCNLSKIIENYRLTSTTFQQYANGASSQVYYAMKANGASEILDVLKKEGACLEVASVNELKTALDIGFEPARILFTGIGFGLQHIPFIAGSGVVINIDSFTQLELFRPYAPLNISVRFNPGLTTGYNERLEMSGNRVGAGKLGIHHDRILEAFRTARAYGLEPIGLHQHIGSNYFGKNLYAFFEATKITLDVARELGEHGFSLKRLSLGGGMGVRSQEQMQNFPLDAYCSGIWDRVRASKLNFDLVSIEPGRFIVADSTVLLSTVNMVEEKGGVSYIGLDSGFNLFNHKFLYGIEPEIFNVSKISRENTNGYCVAGYLGESGDVFSQDKQLPETGLGDIIGIYPAGAYCASEMASFHMQQMPSQLFLEAEKNGFDIFPFCKACPRNCCYIGAVNVLPGEYRQIVERTGREDVFKPHNDYYIIDKKKGEPCPFLGRDGVTCTIQDIKPADCKVWPLYFDERGEPEHNLISPACPAHAFLPENYIQTLRNDLREIPENLREDYYNDTKLFGYQLEPLKNKL